MYFNRIILIGRVVADPEIRYTPTGSKVSTFRIAVDRTPRQGPEGERISETDFFRVVTFGRQADFVGTYLTKGRLVLVEGEMRMNRWVDDLGNKRVSYEVSAFRVRLLDKKPQILEETELGGVEEEDLDIVDESDFGDDEPPF